MDKIGAEPGSIILSDQENLVGCIRENLKTPRKYQINIKELSETFIL